MVNKDLLKKEMLEKVKLGVKPSDFKRQGKINTNILTFPDSPIIEPIKIHRDKNQTKIIDKDTIKQLQEQANYWATTANNYLTDLQRTMAQLDSAELEIEDLQGKIKEKQQELERMKEGLKNNKAETKEIGTQTENNRIFTIKNHSCDVCQTNHQERLPSQFLRVKGLGGEIGKKIWVCSACRKNVVVIFEEEENWRDW